MDFHCLFEVGEKAYLKEWGESRKCFDPQPCPYFVFRRNAVSSQLEIDIRSLEAPNFTSSPNGVDLGPPGQLRLILTPARIPSNSNVDAPLPFSNQNFSILRRVLQFHRGVFEQRSHPSQLARLRIPEKVTCKNSWSSGRNSLTNQALYLSTLADHGNLSTRVKMLLAFDESERITTVLLHNLQPSQHKIVEERIQDTSLQPLSIHPMFVPTLVMELLFSDISALTQNAQSVWERAVRAGVLTDAFYSLLKSKNVDIEQETSRATHSNHETSWIQELLEVAIDSGTKLILWSEDFHTDACNKDDAQTFHHAGSILRNRLEYLVDRLNIQLIWIKRVQRDMQVFRQVLEVRNATIGNDLSRDIAQESRRDSSAMKAIAVLTMVFLPGTFFATLFAIPLFDKTIANEKYWFFWVVTIPTTIFVLLIWRVWYKFQEWQKEWQKVNGRRPFYVEFLFWLNCRQTLPKDGMKDIEIGNGL